ncbi:MAG: hypothetical protein WBJ41_16945 [Chromatiaceae bacterium]
MLLVYDVIAGQEIGLEGDRLREFAMGILVMGFGTLLNGLASRFSAGHLLVIYPGPLIMAVFIGVAQAAGPGAAADGALTSGLALLVLGRFLPVLRLLFPAEVSGVLLMLLSMSLIPSRPPQHPDCLIDPGDHRCPPGLVRRTRAGPGPLHRRGGRTPGGHPDRSVRRPGIESE